jgi:hypothetical protein
MLVPVTDEAGAPLLDEQGNVQYASRTDTVRRVLEESWNRNAALVSNPTGEGWRAYLDTQGTTGDAGDRHIQYRSPLALVGDSAHVCSVGESTWVIPRGARTARTDGTGAVL